MTSQQQQAYYEQQAQYEQQMEDSDDEEYEPTEQGKYPYLTLNF